MLQKDDAAIVKALTATAESAVAPPISAASVSRMSFVRAQAVEMVHAEGSVSPGLSAVAPMDVSTRKLKSAWKAKRPQGKGDRSIGSRLLWSFLLAIDPVFDLLIWPIALLAGISAAVLSSVVSLGLSALAGFGLSHLLFYAGGRGLLLGLACLAVMVLPGLVRNPSFFRRLFGVICLCGWGALVHIHLAGVMPLWACEGAVVVLTVGLFAVNSIFRLAIDLLKRDRPAEPGQTLTLRKPGGAFATALTVAPDHDQVGDL